jgi:hypothetical protein
MDTYAALLFLHLVGATAMFSGWAIEFRVLAGGNGPSRADRAALLGPVGMTIAFLTGVAMMLWQWGQQPWMPVAIGGVALLIVVGIGAAIAVRRGPADPARRARIEVASLGARVGIGLALLAIMAAKPGTAASVALLAFGLLAGLVPAALRPRANATAARSPVSEPR